MKKTFAILTLSTALAACGGASESENTPNSVDESPGTSPPVTETPVDTSGRTGGPVSAFVKDIGINVVWGEQEGYVSYTIHASTVPGTSINHPVKDVRKDGLGYYLDFIYHEGIGVPVYVSVVGHKADGSFEMIGEELEIIPVDFKSNPDAYMNERYEAIEGGSVIRDTVTGLEWQRCSVGQTWTGVTCEGQINRFQYEEAEALSDGQWRLPTDIELASLIYCSSGQPMYRNFDNNRNFRCDLVNSWPTIDEAAFPETDQREYWTQKVSAGVAKVLPASIDFQNGIILRTGLESNRNSVRLVR